MIAHKIRTTPIPTIVFLLDVSACLQIVHTLLLNVHPSSQSWHSCTDKHVTSMCDPVRCTHRALEQQQKTMRDRLDSLNVHSQRKPHIMFFIYRSLLAEKWQMYQAKPITQPRLVGNGRIYCSQTKTIASWCRTCNPPITSLHRNAFVVWAKLLRKQISHFSKRREETSYADSGVNIKRPNGRKYPLWSITTSFFVTEASYALLARGARHNLVTCFTDSPVALLDTYFGDITGLWFEY